MHHITFQEWPHNYWLKLRIPYELVLFDTFIRLATTASLVIIRTEIKVWCLEHYSGTIATHGIIVWSLLTWSCYSMTYPHWIQLSTMGDRKWSIRRITIQKLTDCIIHHRQFLSSACSMKWLVSSGKLITLKYDMELSRQIDEWNGIYDFLQYWIIAFY